MFKIWRVASKVNEEEYPTRYAFTAKWNILYTALHMNEEL